MELRSVPAGLPGPADQAALLAHVRAELPDLRDAAQRALARVDLAGRPRAEAAEELGVTASELSRLLASGRKAMRRQLAQLPSGGWCERAERLISDRLDGALAASGAARLDAHLASCERCVVHKRKLVQAHDRLVAGYVQSHVAPQPALPAAAPARELRLVEEQAEAEPPPPPETPATAQTPPPVLAQPVQAAIERRLAAFVWHLAFALAVVLAIATVVITVLAGAGTIRHVP